MSPFEDVCGKGVEVGGGHGGGVRGRGRGVGDEVGGVVGVVVVVICGLLGGEGFGDEGFVGLGRDCRGCCWEGWF